MSHAIDPAARRRACARASVRAPLVVACAAALLGGALGTALAQEAPTPSDSTRLVVTGCLKGRVLTVTGNPNEEGATISGPDVTGRAFRLAGPKDLMGKVKAHDRHLVEVVGLVKSADLAERPGFNVGRTRVTVGVAVGSDPARSGAQQQALVYVAVMDVTAVTFVSDACPLSKR